MLDVVPSEDVGTVAANGGRFRKQRYTQILLACGSSILQNPPQTLLTSTITAYTHEINISIPLPEIQIKIQRLNTFLFTIDMKNVHTSIFTNRVPNRCSHEAINKQPKCTLLLTWMRIWVSFQVDQPLKE